MRKLGCKGVGFEATMLAHGKDEAERRVQRHKQRSRVVECRHAEPFGGLPGGHLDALWPACKSKAMRAARFNKVRCGLCRPRRKSATRTKASMRKRLCGKARRTTSVSSHSRCLADLLGQTSGCFVLEEGHHNVAVGREALLGDTTVCTTHPVVTFLTTISLGVESGIFVQSSCFIDVTRASASLCMMSVGVLVSLSFTSFSATQTSGSCREATRPYWFQSWPLPSCRLPQTFAHSRET